MVNHGRLVQKLVWIQSRFHQNGGDDRIRGVLLRSARLNLMQPGIKYKNLFNLTQLRHRCHHSLCVD